MYKKIIALILVALTLTACGGKSGVEKFSFNIDELEVSPPTSWKNEKGGTQRRTARRVVVQDKIDTKRFKIGSTTIDIDEICKPNGENSPYKDYLDYDTNVILFTSVENKSEENLILNLLDSSLKINGTQCKPLVVIDGNYNSDKLDEKFNGQVVKSVALVVDKSGMRSKKIETVEWNIDAPTDNDGNKVGKDIRITIPVR